MTRRLLKGEALQAYNTETTATGFTETNVTHELCMQQLFIQIFPQQALQAQKRYMKRILRKPKDVSIRAYLAWFVETNEKLNHFPPFNDDQKISKEEILNQTYSFEREEHNGSFPPC